jgi:hypothetical protein
VGPSREWLFTLIYLPRVSVTSGRDNSLSRLLKNSLDCKV